MTEPIPPGRWGGDHLGETRCVLEAARLTVDPVWHGRGGIPPGDGRARTNPTRILHERT